jgi:hypothetical protein
MVAKLGKRSWPKSCGTRATSVSLFGRILVIVAHQDDETACSVLLQRAREAWVVFATDGAPASEFFWGS